MPLDQARSFANSFANNNLSVSSTGAGSTAPVTAGLGFGFNASLVKVIVDVGTVYLNFTSTILATTSDHKQTSGDGPQDYYTFGVPVGGMCFAATSTAPAVRVGAWG